MIELFQVLKPRTTVVISGHLSQKDLVEVHSRMVSRELLRDLGIRT